MKRFLTAALVTTLLIVPAAFADDAHHPESNEPAAKAPLKAPAPRTDEKAMKQMQDHMAQMQELMAKAQKTTDPVERQKLLDEHTKSMQQGMATMHDSGGCMMQGMMGTGMMGGGMGMMQMMMEHMMAHQQMQGGDRK